MCCFFLNLVKISKSSSYSCLSNYFTLSVPALSLLVILYMGALSFIRFSILNLYFSLYSYYIRILYLNFFIVSFISRFISRSLKPSYFIILLLVFLIVLNVVYKRVVYTSERPTLKTYQKLGNSHLNILITT